MKKFLFVVAALTVLVSCGSSKPEKTIENLKTAATGESNASAMYAKFAEKAVADSMFSVAEMFRATSQAEAIHAKNHLAVLKELGVDFTPVVEDIIVNVTLENLSKAKSGEDYEISEMYPGFIKTAEQEKATSALNSFNWAMKAEAKHSKFYEVALQMAMEDGNDSRVVGEWVVCPICGDTYRKSEAGASCALCGATSDKFISFSSQ